MNFRRLKKDVLSELPAKTREILYLSGEKLTARMDTLKKARESYEKIENFGVSLVNLTVPFRPKIAYAVSF